MAQVETAWVEDNTPAGASLSGTWNWNSYIPGPHSGSLAHQSTLASGLHQHYFKNATAGLSVLAGDTLFTYVYLDPANPPIEIMLQLYDGNWNHRAYWGANIIAKGTDGTNSRRYMGFYLSPATGFDWKFLPLTWAWRAEHSPEWLLISMTVR